MFVFNGLRKMAGWRGVSASSDWQPRMTAGLEGRRFGRAWHPDQAGFGQMIYRSKVPIE
ncbi:hypothetical protein RSSM_04182 [Rhodopirellula sallentina SM41]|uniref:Uncharacterized protein n=1 Tax=Rhodopirellula sallentina SM41 TaxID=1263870 RepID=M5TYR4_9BACT|nr:hypothetical protein RSSM_04182 [Rhodopirellula sallentina SM41]